MSATQPPASASPQERFSVVYASYARAYERFLDKHGVDPSRSAMFEDIAKNLVVPHDLGMTTTLVIPKTIDPFREEVEQTAVEAPHIDHITNDLASFLVARAPLGQPPARSGDS